MLADRYSRAKGRCKRRQWLVTLVAVLVLPLSSRDLAAQGSVEAWGNGVAWRVSDEVPAGTISGLVLSPEGMPLEGASISVVGRQMRVGSDPDGRFTLSPPFAGDWELEIWHSRFGPVGATIAVPWDYGVFVAVILQQRRGIHGLCDRLIVRRRGSSHDDDLNIQVVDSVTGIPPETTIEVRVEHESGVWVNRVHLDLDRNPYGYVGLGRPIDTEGLHYIEVSAVGYRTWRVEDVELRLMPGCRPMLLNRDYEVRLVPIR